jgi:glycosyltransferase involved in cell wall biosynthesis
MSQKEVASLYKNKKITGLISATKGEGYGLPLIEAAAQGIPIVATGWSGHNEFLDKSLYLDVDYTLEQINESRADGRVFVKNSRWAKVSENDFKRKIQDLRDNYELHCKNANKLQKKIKENFCKSSVISKYSEFFDEFRRIS